MKSKKWDEYCQVFDWVQQNVGKRFKTRETGKMEFYYDKSGNRHLLTVPAKDSEKLIKLLKFYIDTTRNQKCFASVTFNEDFSQFKIENKCHLSSSVRTKSQQKKTFGRNFKTIEKG